MASPTSDAKSSYYILQNSETKGPYTIGQLRSMWNAGALTGDTLYCEEGYKKWLKLTFIADQLEARSAPSIPPASLSPLPTRSEQRKSSGVGRALGVGCLGIFCVVVLLAVIGNFVDDKASEGDTTREPYATDPATQQKLEAAIAGYQVLGVFTKIQSYSGDQVWVYVSERFSKLTIDDKHRAVAAVYSVYHNKESVDFVVLVDAYTGKNIGMYKPSYGLKLN